VGQVYLNIKNMSPSCCSQPVWLSSVCWRNDWIPIQDCTKLQ